MQNESGDLLCLNVRKDLDLKPAEFGRLIGFKHPAVRISEIENNRVKLSNIVRQSIINLYLVARIQEEFLDEIL